MYGTENEVAKKYLWVKRKHEL